MKCNDDYWDNAENDIDNKCFQQQLVFIHDGYGNNQSSKSKTRRRRWTQKDMTNAFNAVKCTGMSLRGAASHYNVPESTLRDRIHGRVSLDCSRPGPPTFFTFEEEKKMVDHILFMSKIGYPYTRNQVVELAGDMTKAVDRIAPFKFLNPSQAWFYAFLNRWPDLKNYLYGPRSNRKSKGVSAESIQAYYDNLDKVLIKYDIKNKPDHIWMTDEVSIACDNSNVPKILPITIQRSQSNTYWNPTAAVIGAGNAAGDKIPAFLMFKASHITDEMMEGSVKGSKFATSNTGWVNADAFIQWYERHFRPLITQRPVILLYDGHLQFVTVRVLEKAKEDNVLLFPLPPHPPYNHCVESSCFAAYPKYFTRRIQKYHSDLKRNGNKTNVSRIICQTYEWALKPINLIQIFFKLGICPYNNLSSSLAPYMPNSSDEDQNEDTMCGMDINEPDFGYFDHPPLPPPPQVPVSVSPPVTLKRPMGLTSMPQMPAKSDLSAPLDPSVTPYPCGGGVKVLDNMASKAMNQMHASRAEMAPVKMAAASPDSIAIQTKILSLKNSGSGKSSIILRPNRTAQVVPAMRKTEGVSGAVRVSLSGAGARGTQIRVLHTSNNQEAAGAVANASKQPVIHLQAAPVPVEAVPVVPLPVATVTPVDEEEDDQENSEMNQTCRVCGMVEPPGLSQTEVDSEELVVDWAHCDFCHEWVHLQPCCDSRCVLPDNRFKCVICIKQDDDNARMAVDGEGPAGDQGGS